MRTALPFLTLLAVACTGTSDSAAGDSAVDTAPTGPGTLALAFQMEADLIPSMDEPPVGTFEGSIYAEDDCTAVGPVDGAASLEDFSVAVDLTDGGGPTAALYATQPLDPQIVWIVGCLDTDANGCGDVGDPITVPNDDKVIVVAEAATPFTVQMNMLRP